MLMREGANKSSARQWHPGVTGEVEDRDFDSVCRLQKLISELLVKNELLRHQLHRNGLMLEKVQQLLEADRPGGSEGMESLKSLLQGRAGQSDRGDQSRKPQTNF